MDVSCDRAATEEVGHQLMATEWHVMEDLLAQKEVDATAREAQWVTMVEETCSACPTVTVARTE
jgi:hypothetical protein